MAIKIRFIDKIKFIIVSILSLMCMESLFSQNKISTEVVNMDSLLIVNGHWKYKKLTKGVSLLQMQFKDSSLFNSNQFISIIEIDKKIIGKKRGVRFDILAKEVLVETSNFAKEANAIAAINGSFFALRRPYNSVDFIRVDGVDLAPNVYKADSTRLFHQEGAIVINKRGKLSILKPATTQDYSILEWERGVEAEDIMTSGPLLRIGGVDEPLADISHVKSRHPRTVIAKEKDGTVLLVTIDGRSKEAAGMSLIEVQNVLRWLGAHDVLSLDGGGSTTMYTKLEGVVNHPSDNKKFDNQGARKVANVVVVR